MEIKNKLVFNMGLMQSFLIFIIKRDNDLLKKWIENKKENDCHWSGMHGRIYLLGLYVIVTLSHHHIWLKLVFDDWALFFSWLSQFMHCVRLHGCH